MAQVQADQALSGKAPAREKVATPGPAVGHRVQLRGLSYAEQVASLAPVQAADGELPGAATHEHASRGVSGSGAPLPHGAAIQRSFGAHGVAGVQAHIGGAAGDAARAIGAQAYATGNHVAFQSQPDMHTAAHEAAHVVQQRHGVSLKGGVGAAGDPYERHADSVADAVVAGRSAETLLSSGPGGGSGRGVQREGEGKGAWAKQLVLTKDSFFDLVMINQAAANAWKTRASADEPPPFWKQALMSVGSLVLTAALGGLGGALASKLTKGVKFVANAAIRAAIKIGEGAAKGGVGAAVEAAAGEGDAKKKALVAYCHQQSFALIEASKAARERFVNDAGDFDDQKLNIEQMKELKEKNDASFADAKRIQAHEMLVGWMGMLAGDTTKTPGSKGAPTEGNVEDIDNDGVLRITISGYNDTPLSILDAKAEGLNPQLRKDISGSKLGDWLVGGTRKHGIDVLVTTGAPNITMKSFQLSAASWARAQKAGKAPSKSYVAGKKTSAFFSFFAERTGGARWIDSDMDLRGDYGWGADVGRWFLQNVKNAQTVLTELGSRKIPNVST